MASFLLALNSTVMEKPEGEEFSDLLDYVYHDPAKFIMTRQSRGRTRAGGGFAVSPRQGS